VKDSLQDAIKEELPDANYPDFEPGDKIRVTSTKEIGGQERKRHFEGVCIARRGEGPDETFKVRKVSFGVGVERIFPLHSPTIDEITIQRKGKVRQAKLNYLEDRSSKESRIKEERVDLDEVNRTESKEAPGHAGEAVADEDSEETTEASAENADESAETSEDESETEELEDETAEENTDSDDGSDESTEDKDNSD
jgi:large subunit ribosomal protein L19